jgi:vacuolar-type H+-ATPase subunit F/Vma7
MRVVAVGGKAFVTGFALSGVRGEYVSSPDEALGRIESLVKDPQVGLIVVSDEIAKPLVAQLTALRAQRATPLIYEVPGPGSMKEKVDYRAMLRRILGV